MKKVIFIIFWCFAWCFAMTQPGIATGQSPSSWKETFEALVVDGGKLLFEALWLGGGSLLSYKLQEYFYEDAQQVTTVGGTLDIISYSPSILIIHRPKERIIQIHNHQYDYDLLFTGKMRTVVWDDTDERFQSLQGALFDADNGNQLILPVKTVSTFFNQQQED